MCSDDYDHPLAETAAEESDSLKKRVKELERKLDRIENAPRSSDYQFPQTACCLSQTFGAGY